MNTRWSGVTSTSSRMSNLRPPTRRGRSMYFWQIQVLPGLRLRRHAASGTAVGTRRWRAARASSRARRGRAGWRGRACSLMEAQARRARSLSRARHTRGRERRTEWKQNADLSMSQSEKSVSPKTWKSLGKGCACRGPRPVCPRHPRAHHDPVTKSQTKTFFQ